MAGSVLNVNVKGKALVKIINSFDSKAHGDEEKEFAELFRAFHRTVSEITTRVADEECIDEDRLIGNEIHVTLKFISDEEAEKGVMDSALEHCHKCDKCHKEDED